MIVGSAGHIDHGKTSLVRALTGVDADRLQEEKARGITIDIGFAYMPGADGKVIGFVDVPGHERFVHNMLVGATGIDFALLVVAADDGVMPQTREHLAILDLLGIERGIVALTKADLVEPDRLAASHNEVANALLGTKLEGIEIIPTSYVTGIGISELHGRLLEASMQEHRQEAGAFRLAVDRCFTLPGAGTVVTGIVLSGSVAVGDHVVISPKGISARIRGLHAQNMKAQRGMPGDRCALNLAGEAVSKDAISRGDMVLDASLHAPCDRIDARLRVLASETKPVSQWMPVRFHHAASEVGARIVLLGEQPIAPGEEGFVQLVLEQPVAMASGDRFVLRDTSAQRTIGGGRLLDLRAPARKRRTPERMAQLAAYCIADPEHALLALLASPPHYLDINEFRRDFALTPSQIEAVAERSGLIRLRAESKTLVIAPATWPRLRRTIVERLEKFHLENRDLPGIGIERLRLQIEPRLPAPAFISVLRDLTSSGAVALDGAWVKLPSHVVRLMPQDEALWAAIAPLLGGAARFRPPRVRDIADLRGERETEVRRLLKRLGRMGRVDEIDHDHFFLRSTVAEIVEIACELGAAAKDGQFNVAQLRDRLDNGRKVTIHILEFFDRHGVTFRRGDARRINKNRLDLFRPPVGEALVEEIVSNGRDASPVGRPDFKSGRGRETVFGGFDSHSLPPEI